jgi:hypothetical protein
MPANQSKYYDVKAYRFISFRKTKQSFPIDGQITAAASAEDKAKPESGK